MTIEVDDAGYGSPILGEAFLINRLETGEKYFAYIKPNEKKRANIIIEVLAEMLKKLQPNENEEIILCRGKVFNGFHQYLNQNFKYNVRRDKVSDITNDLVEDYFSSLLFELGYPKELNLVNRDYSEFYKRVLIWYLVFGKDKSLIKDTAIRKDHYRHYIINSVLNYPNLMKQLFYDEKTT